MSMTRWRFLMPSRRLDGVDVAHGLGLSPGSVPRVPGVLKRSQASSPGLAPRVEVGFSSSGVLAEGMGV
jgi:hypothetical protein